MPAFLHLWGQGPPRRTHRGQQFLFYWAEFLAEEPAQPRGLSGKPKPSSPPLFEWALTAEQEREEEPVGAGR